MAIFKRPNFNVDWEPAAPDTLIKRAVFFTEECNFDPPVKPDWLNWLAEDDFTLLEYETVD